MGKGTGPEVSDRSELQIDRRPTSGGGVGRVPSGDGSSQEATRVPFSCPTSGRY